MLPSHRISLFSLVVALLLGTAACKGFESNLQDTKVDYLPTAKENFGFAQESMEDERFNEAIKLFEYVKNKFPYSRFAVLADLSIADCHYQKEEWLEAADAYRLFARFHPRHEKVAYATFRVAASYYYETHSDFLGDWEVPVVSDALQKISIFPPQEENDQTAIVDAIRAFDQYLGRFPDGENVEEAKEMRDRARTGLAAHDFYAASFYEKRGKYQGAVWRYESIAKKFNDTPIAAEALLEAARIAETDMDDLKLSRSLYERLLAAHNASPESAAAKAELADVEKEISKRKANGTLEQTLATPWDKRGPGPWGIEVN